MSESADPARTSHAELCARLAAALARPLPGTAAQLRLAPRPRHGWTPGRIPADQRPAAGLVLLYPRSSATHLALTVRHPELPQHAGQVSLPGGAVEPGESIEAAALREAEEEIAVEAGRVEVLGRLTPLHIPVSGFVLHPVVGTLDGRPRLKRKPDEVDRILEVPLSAFGETSRYGSQTRRYQGLDIDVPYFAFEGHKVWGATAMVLCELLALLGVEIGSG